MHSGSVLESSNLTCRVPITLHANVHVCDLLSLASLLILYQYRYNICYSSKRYKLKITFCLLQRFGVAVLMYGEVAGEPYLLIVYYT